MVVGDGGEARLSPHLQCEVSKLENQVIVTLCGSKNSHKTVKTNEKFPVAIKRIISQSSTALDYIHLILIGERLAYLNTLTTFYFGHCV